MWEASDAEMRDASQSTTASDTDSEKEWRRSKEADDEIIRQGVAYPKARRRARRHSLETPRSPCKEDNPL